MQYFFKGHGTLYFDKNIIISVVLLQNHRWNHLAHKIGLLICCSYGSLGLPEKAKQFSDDVFAQLELKPRLWECEYCGYRGLIEEEVASHEETCSKNPAFSPLMKHNVHVEQA